MVLLSSSAFLSETATDWSSLYRRVTNLLIADLNITGSSQWANNDGIDLESCTNATLVRLNIDVGDDGIVFAAGNTNDLNHAWPEPPGRYTPLAHVRVADCRVRSRSSGLKFEAIFQAAHGRVSDIDIRNVEVHGSNRGLGFQQRTGGGPDASLWSDVFVHNLTVHSVFTRGTNWWGAGEPIWMTSIAEGERVDTPLGGIRNVTISQCVARAANTLLISALGVNAGTIQDVVIDDLDLTIESLPGYRADPTLVRAIRDYRPIDDSSFPQFLPSPVVAVAVEGPVKRVAFTNAAIRYEVVEGQDGTRRAARRQAAPPAVPYWVRGMCFNATADADVSFANLQCAPAF